MTPGPTVVRRQLGRRLKTLREATGLTVDEVAAERQLGISRAKLYKLEAGRHPAKPQDITVLCTRYGVTPPYVSTLQALALATQEASWWHRYGEDAVPEWFSLRVELELVATSIRTYESEYVPGLLQTEDYARAVYEAYQPVENDEIEGRIAVRMDRQSIFDGIGPNLHAVINEAALLRTVGGGQVMAAQLAKLRESASRPGTRIDVLPLSAGAHPAMGGAFALLDFADPVDDPPVAYVETASSAAYLQKPCELDRYRTIFTRLLSSAIPIEEYSP